LSLLLRSLTTVWIEFGAGFDLRNRQVFSSCEKVSRSTGSTRAISESQSNHRPAVIKIMLAIMRPVLGHERESLPAAHVSQRRQRLDARVDRPLNLAPTRACTGGAHARRRIAPTSQYERQSRFSNKANSHSSDCIAKAWLDWTLHRILPGRNQSIRANAI
jgi:hypothetical protein